MAGEARSLEAPRELDEVTLRRAQRGDARAFRVLVELYHVRVYSLLWRMLERSHGSARVEELTQETFLRVFRSLDGFDARGPARLSTWVLTIATRLALNERRRKLLAPTALREVVDGGTVLEDAASALDRRHQVERLREAIDGLTPDHRAVVVLREYHELEYSEIAEALEIDVGTVKSRLSRARAALRDALGGVRHE
jgi:RNA polymerase sigma-70 factor (ECF subfamily)